MSTSRRRLIIHWFRRDLRLADNTAFYEACRDGDAVLPVFVTSEWRKAHLWTGQKRQAFLCDSLEHLSGAIEKQNGRLVFRSGEADAELKKLIEERGAEALYFNRDPDPFGKAMEGKVAAMCREAGVECRAFNDVTVHTAEEVLTKTGGPYKVFTPYSRNWLSLEKPAVLPKFAGELNTPAGIRSNKVPDLAHWGLKAEGSGILKGGEREAHKRLEAFLEDAAAHYEDRRDLPGEAGTSRISQDLRFGLISARTVFHRAMEAQASLRSEKAKKNLDVFIKELAWREFYMALLQRFPQVLEREFNPQWIGLPWDEPGKKFEAWKTGMTGFPIVDAGMRQLLETGFMHNRVRMIVAMFLTKDLHLDWRLGEQFFMQHLVDGEIASNNGGWQWSAGTGADAAPYFRIQNPWAQGKRYDPDGDYIKRWVPELKGVAAKKLHEVPSAPLAKGYPLPCVDHSKERDRTLAIFKKHRAKKH